ncbi:MAG: VTT domain-containing protein [Acidobacteriota bacterium]
MSTTIRWLLLAGVMLALILIPFAIFEAPITQWTRAWLARPQTPWVLGVGIAALLASDVLLPVPSSIVSLGAGALLGFGGGTLASSIGMTLGCSAGYWVGRRGARRPAEKLLGTTEMARLERAQQRWGEWMVLLMRPVPVLAEASVVFAGMGSMRFVRFLLMTTLANVAISGAYAWMGASVMVSSTNSVHDFTMKAIDGKEVNLADYKGKVLLIVNVASKCGYTPQYKGLEAVYRQYKDRGLVVMGFPANNFLWQEPGSDQEIASFCQRSYDVTFPMFAKISVLGGDKAPLYEYLTSDAANKQTAGMIKWNFTKFLVDGDGKPIARFGPSTEPGAPEVAAAIEKALAH